MDHGDRMRLGLNHVKKNIAPSVENGVGRFAASNLLNWGDAARNVVMMPIGAPYKLTTFRGMDTLNVIEYGMKKDDAGVEH